MKISSIFVIFFAFLCPFLGANGAKILGIFHPPAPSHYFVGSTLMKALAKKGHEVTMISSFENKEKMANWRDIVLTGQVEEAEAMKQSLQNMPDRNILSSILHVFTIFPMMAEKALNHTNVQKLLKSNEKFDLVIMEAFLNEFHVGLGHHFGCPIIAVSTIGATSWINILTGNPAPSSYVSEMLLSSAGKLTFTQRLQNFLVGTFLSLYMEFVHIPKMDGSLHKYFPEAPSIKELFKTVSMVLLNSHVSVSPAKPHLPNMVEIGGFHVDAPKELPKDLREFLDNCKEGVILFSMGSNFKSTFFKPEVKKVLMEAFQKLKPYQILWKYEEQLPGIPSNVRIEKWLPQNDILAHPNLKLFITHGGLLSTTEAVYHGVPIVGIPVFGDQKMNMARSENIGIGKALDFKNLEVESIVSTVKEVIQNPKYRKNVQKRSAVMKDRPLKPRDEAVFWVEHVLRHKGGEHFKTSALDLNYFEYYQLDVLAFLGAILALGLYVPYKVLKFCGCRKKGQKEVNLDSKKKTN